jgi:hypothetical protein
MKGMRRSQVEQERAREMRKLKSLEQQYHHDLLSADEREKVWNDWQAMKKKLGVNG